MSEEETKLAILEKQKQRMADLTKENREQDLKLKAKDAELDKAEKEQQKLERERMKLDKRVKHGAGRAERLAVDSIGSTGAQLLNIGEQALLDYLIAAFPKSLGAHQVLTKSAPPVMASNTAANVRPRRRKRAPASMGSCSLFNADMPASKRITVNHYNQGKRLE